MGRENIMPPRISVIVPSYNMADYIGDTISSVVDQGYPDCECLVMDGGSTDGTIEILKRFGDRITWVSEKDNGQSDAINKGLRLASGDIVTYLNADDVYEKDCLGKVAGYFEKNPDVMWLYGKCRIVDRLGREVRRPVTWYKNFWQRRYSYLALLVTDFIAQPAAFWRRQLTEEMGLFDVDEHLVMEYEYWLRIGAKYQPGFIDDYLARFRLHPVSKSATRFSDAARSAFRVARRYAAGQGRGFLVPLQYLNYLTVVSVYSLLRAGSLGRRVFSPEQSHPGNGL